MGIEDGHNDARNMLRFN